MKKIYSFCLGLLSIIYVDAQVNLTSGLMAYYPFNGNAGDSSGNLNSPSFNNATLTTDRFGNANKAYAFNGTNAYIKVPTSTSLNCGTKISISVWVKVNGFHYGTCFGNNILAKGIGGSGDALTGNYLLRFDNSLYSNNQNCNQALPDTLHQNFHAYDVKSSNYINKNTWYYLTYTCDAIKSRFYINYIQVDSAAANNISFTNTYDLYFGYSNNSVNPFWLNGALDDIRIYNRAININEITALYNDNTVLPLTLLAFKGQQQNTAINLQWTTANEINTASFTVQRSTNGVDFIDIGSVTANGNTNSKTTYAFTDPQPNINKNCYRLKMIDKDGSFTYSSALAFTLQEATTITFKLSPNPAKTYVQLQINSKKDETINIVVFDAVGKTIITQKSGVSIGTNVITINNINTLKSGLYFVKMIVNGEANTQKLIVE